ncbi:MAG TPA: CoA pyrophosphatase [Acidimicrobiales bacterium]|nr:CoA pyrophosphatase [Acidimicrobiales bacterium]
MPTPEGQPATDAHEDDLEEAVADPIDGYDPPILSAREAARRGMPGFPRPGEPFPPPPVPVPSGRGGDQIIPRPLTARAGRPAPWADLPAAARRPRLDDVREALGRAGPALPSERETLPGIDRASAVLAPLYEDDGELWVVLTRRTWNLRSHSGEVSFPGGGQDPGETLWETALREAQEEIGLPPDDVEQIGELDHLATVTSRSFIVPYVGALPGRPDTRPNPAEVSAVLHVPVAELLDPAIYREERWQLPWAEDRPIFFFELEGDTLWGATAAMLRQLLGLVTGTLARGQLDHL